MNEINIIAKIGDVFIPISINAEFIRRYGENIDVRGGVYNSETNYQTIIYNISLKMSDDPQKSNEKFGGVEILVYLCNQKET